MSITGIMGVGLSDSFNKYQAETLLSPPAATSQQPSSRETQPPATQQDDIYNVMQVRERIATMS